MTMTGRGVPSWGSLLGAGGKFWGNLGNCRMSITILQWKSCILYLYAYYMAQNYLPAIHIRFVSASNLPCLMQPLIKVTRFYKVNDVLYLQCAEGSCLIKPLYPSNLCFGHARASIPFIVLVVSICFVSWLIIVFYFVYHLNLTFLGRIMEQIWKQLEELNLVSTGFLDCQCC